MKQQLNQPPSWNRAGKQSAINKLTNYSKEAYNGAARCDPVSSDHRCCAERRLLNTWVAAARRHGVPQHKVVPWVRRKLGPAVVVLRFRGDGQLGCSVPCVLCQRELQRFDLSVHCYLGDGDDGRERGWFRGRLTDAGAPTPVLTAGQRRTLNLDPLPGRPQPPLGGPVHAPTPACRKADRCKSKKSSPR